MPGTKTTRPQKPIDERIALKIAKRDRVVSRFEAVKEKLDRDIERLTAIRDGVKPARVRKATSPEQLEKVQMFLSLSDEERQATLRELKEKTRIMRLAEKLRRDEAVRKTSISEEEETVFEEEDDDDDGIEEDDDD